jgi:ESS family glutamate:Na+ symporter
MTPSTVGLGLVFLGLMLAVSSLIRGHVRIFQRLHVPSAVIGGFVTLLAGPQVFGEGVFPPGVLDVWATLPSLLINVVFAALLIGKTLPSMRALWETSAPHVIGGMLYSFGQLAIASVAVLLVLGPYFGLPPEAGGLLEMSFAGGHGTVAGLEAQFRSHGVEDLADLGLALATLSLAIGVVLGTVMVNRMRARGVMETANEDEDIDIGRISHDVNDPPVPAHVSGQSALASAIMFIAIAIGAGIVILEFLRWLEHRVLETHLLEYMPLFPLALVGGALVQLLARPLRYENAIDRRMVSDVGGAALDMLLISAIGTMSLEVIGREIESLLILAALGTAWSVIVFVFIGPKMFVKNGLAHASADFGQSMGNVATGFVLADMADPKGVTEARVGYAYKQLAYEPFFGGGIITALSVPLIALGGLPLFTVVSAIGTVVIGIWGIRRIRSMAARDAVH